MKKKSKQLYIQVLPKCIAVPYCGVSDRLGIQPIMGHPSLALANVKMDNKTGLVMLFS